MAAIYNSWTGNTSTSGTITCTAGNTASNWITWDSTDLQAISQALKATPDSKIEMPDGSVIQIDDKGNFTVEDKDAKVIYQASRIREFNPYVNAGDLLGSFIDFVRQSVPGVRRADIPELPVQLFVNWLILEAAQRDGDPVPSDVVPLPDNRLLVARIRPRCLLPVCRRFIARSVAMAGFNYCNPPHAERHMKLLIAGHRGGQS